MEEKKIKLLVTRHNWRFVFLWRLFWQSLTVEQHAHIHSRSCGVYNVESFRLAKNAPLDLQGDGARQFIAKMDILHNGWGQRRL